MATSQRLTIRRRDELLGDSLLTRVDLCGGWMLSFYRRCDIHCVYCSSAIQGRSEPIVAPGEVHEQLAFELLDVSRDELVAVGGIRDVYCGTDQQLGLARIALEVLVDQGRRFVVITKGVGVLRDAELLAGASDAAVCISMSTLDPAESARLEPRAESPQARIDVAHELHERGVSVVVKVTPWIPRISDVAAVRQAVDPAIPLDVAPLLVEGGVVWTLPYSQRFDQRGVDRVYLRCCARECSLPATRWFAPMAAVSSSAPGGGLMSVVTSANHAMTLLDSIGSCRKRDRPRSMRSACG